MLSPYDKRTENTRNRIMGSRDSYYPNKHYKSAEGNFYYYINTKGYLHIIQPCRVTLNGNFSHYKITDSLLTKDNMLKETSSYGYYRTVEELADALQNNTA